MRWTTENLLLLFILGSIFVLASTLRLRVIRPKWWLLAIGIAFWLVTTAGAAVVLLGPPGRAGTVVVPKTDQPIGVTAAAALDRLRLSWDSEADAGWPAADTLAELSENAYEPPHFAEKSFRALGFDKVTPVVLGSMIGYVVSGEDVTVVVFRGTDFREMSDWLANLERSSFNTEHGPVHRGFYNAYQSMKSQVDAILAERNSAHVWVTGHSLGGALALLCAYDLVEVEQRKIHGVMTFGQPMVARQELSEHFNRVLVHRYVRFVNGADMVARIPPSYAPCGSLVWFTDGGLRRSFVRVRSSAVASAPVIAPVGDDAQQAEIEPLTEEEFEVLQQSLKQKDADAERLPDGSPSKNRAASPLVDDHSMSLYRKRIRALLGLPDAP